jgi:plastocyanin
VDNTTSTIGKAALTANLVGSVNKIYDSSANATLAAGNFSLSGFVTGEGASVTQTAGTYASPNVNANGGTGAVSASLLSSHLSANTGTLLSNYSLPTTASGNVGTITPVALTVKVGDTMAFVTQDARTAIDTGVSHFGLQGTDTLASALVQVPVASDRTYTGATPTPLVGSYSAVYDLGFSPTAQNGNYTVTVQKGDLQVIQADKLLISIASQNDTYGNRNAGNAILVPATNAAGQVGIGTAAPAPGGKAHALLGALLQMQQQQHHHQQHGGQLRGGQAVVHGQPSLVNARREGLDAEVAGHAKVGQGFHEGQRHARSHSGAGQGQRNFADAP